MPPIDARTWAAERLVAAEKAAIAAEMAARDAEKADLAAIRERVVSDIDRMRPELVAANFPMVGVLRMPSTSAG